MNQQQFQAAATAGQPTVMIPTDVYQTLVGQGLIAPGQPAQQIFDQQQQPPPPPASTMSAMGQQQQGGWQQTNQAPVYVPKQQFNAQGQPGAQGFTQQPQPQRQAPQQQPRVAPGERVGSPLEQAAYNFMDLIENKVDTRIERRMEEMMNNNGQQQQQGGVQPPSFFDTTTGKVTIGVGGIGIGVLGTKIFSGIFGGNGNNCSANDASALASAFRTLLR